MRIKKKLIYVVLLGSAIVIGSLQGCSKKEEDPPTPDPDQVAYDAADAVNGGKMYDKFWASETDFVSPVDPNVDIKNITDFGDFYRCKGCHGWDQLGTAASYIDRGPKVSRPSVSSFNLHAFISNNGIRTIFDAVKAVGGRPVDPALTGDGLNGLGNPHPDFSTILTDGQIWDLVKFLKSRAFDVTQLYDITTTGTYPDGSREFSNVGAGGDAAAGTVFYVNNCAGCHGVNGRDDGAGNIIPVNEDIGRSMGEFIREKPYEIQHKAVYGALGSSPMMTGVADATFTDILNMFAALSNTTNYPDL